MNAVFFLNQYGINPVKLCLTETPPILRCRGKEKLCVNLNFISLLFFCEEKRGGGWREKKTEGNSRHTL